LRPGDPIAQRRGGPVALLRAYGAARAGVKEISFQHVDELEAAGLVPSDARGRLH